MKQITNLKKYYISIFIILNSIMIFSCASQLPPGGGEEDKIPPEVISYSPLQAAINFSDDKVVFEFNEYIDKRTFQESIFISPYFEESTGISWSGKEVEIKFPEKLREDQTYVITLGTDISDLRRNKLSETFTLKFTTGDKIDEGSIAGQIYDDNPFNIMVYLFKIDSANSIVQYSDKKPDYVSQTSREGKFNLLGLSKGWYRLIAVRDQFKDLLYQVEQDQVGFTSNDIFLSDSLNKIENIFIEMTKEDTTKPMLLSIKSIDNNHLLVVFNEPIDSTSITSVNISLVDRKENNSVEVIGQFRARLPSTSVYLISTELKPEREYELKTWKIKDNFGNESDTSAISFTTVSEQDTTTPKLLDSRPFEKSATTDYLTPIIYFIYDDFIANRDLKSYITFKDSSNKDIDFEIKFIDQSSFNVIPKLSLAPKMDYKLSLDLKHFKDLAGNKVDSVFTVNFRTNDESYFSEIMGTVKNINKTKAEKVFISARGIDGPRQKYSAKIDSSGKYELKRMLQGSYLLKMFQDASGQGEQIFGSSIKNKFSNKFVYYPDTIKIKPRWPVTDVNFDYDALSR